MGKVDLTITKESHNHIKASPSIADSNKTNTKQRFSPLDLNGNLIMDCCHNMFDVAAVRHTKALYLSGGGSPCKNSTTTNMQDFQTGACLLSAS